MKELYQIIDGKLRLNFHRGQWKAWKSQRRIVAIIAGAQSGKTSWLPFWLYREIKLRGPGDYAFISPTFTLMELKALPEFKRVFEGVFRLGKYTGSPVRRFTFSAKGCRKMFGHVPSIPTQVFFGYAENSDSLESATYKAVVLDEAGQKSFKRSSWEAICRRLAINRGRVAIGTTPYSITGWLKTEILDRFEAGDQEIDVINFPSTANPTFPVEEAERARAVLPYWKYAMFYLGIPTQPAGLIYDSFDAVKCVVPRFRIPAHWPRHVGLDFGPVNTAATFYAEELNEGNKPTGRLFLYRTYHPGKKTPEDHVEAILKDKDMPEPRIPNIVGGSRSEDEWRAKFRDAGLPVGRPLIKDVEVGIDVVYATHARYEIMVFSDLAEYLTEKKSYSRVVDEAGNVDEKIDEKNAFHLMDSERYIISEIRTITGDMTIRVISPDRSGPAPASEPAGPRRSCVRWFAPTQTYQARPEYQGETINLPDFKTESQAAYSVDVFNKLMGVDSPQEVHDLPPEEQSLVENKVRDYLVKRRMI